MFPVSTIGDLQTSRSRWSRRSPSRWTRGATRSTRRTSAPSTSCSERSCCARCTRRRSICALFFAALMQLHVPFGASQVSPRRDARHAGHAEPLPRLARALSSRALTDRSTQRRSNAARKPKTAASAARPSRPLSPTPISSQSPSDRSSSAPRSRASSPSSPTPRSKVVRQSFRWIPSCRCSQ